MTTRDDSFLKVDPVTGAATVVGKTGMGGGIEDLAFGPDGRIVATCWDGEPRLFRLDPQTGNGRPIAKIVGATIPYQVVEGLATADGVLYGSAHDGPQDVDVDGRSALKRAGLLPHRHNPGLAAVQGQA